MGHDIDEDIQKSGNHQLVTKIGRLLSVDYIFLNKRRLAAGGIRVNETHRVLSGIGWTERLQEPTSPIISTDLTVTFQKGATDCPPAREKLRSGQCSHGILHNLEIFDKCIINFDERSSSYDLSYMHPMDPYSHSLMCLYNTFMYFPVVFECPAQKLRSICLLILFPLLLCDWKKVVQNRTFTPTV